MNDKPAVRASRFFRFRISSLLAVVLFAAVSIAALRSASRLWANGLFALILVALTSAFLLTVHRRGRARAFWLGFAFGSIYFAASLIPSLESRLLSSRLLQERSIDDAWFADVVLNANGGASVPVGATTAISNTRAPGAVVTGDVVVFQNPSPSPPLNYIKRLVGLPPGAPPEHFAQVGHSLFTLVIAFFGGCLSRFLAGRNTATRIVGSGEPSHEVAFSR